MPGTSLAQDSTRPRRSLAALIGGFALAFLAVSLVIFLWFEQTRVDSAVRHSMETQAQSSQVEAAILDAETGQRGFLLTGQASYLEPYERSRGAIDQAINALAVATADDVVQQGAIIKLRPLVDEKLRELQETIDLKQAGRGGEALGIVNTNAGRNLMSEIREALRSIRSEEAYGVEQRLRRLSTLDRLGAFALLGSLACVAAFGLIALRGAWQRIAELGATLRDLEAETQERKLAEAQVRQMQRMEAIGQLTGGIAHDFNNILAIVIGSLDLARRRLGDHPDERLVKYIDNAFTGADRGAALTSRLLVFARRQPLEPTVLDLNRLVADMSELLRRTLGEDIAVETVLAGGLWRTFADPAQLENALVNLAVNARDAMPGGGKLTIETANVDLDDRYASQHVEVTPGQYVMVSVTDTGSGMPADVAARAFEPFFTTKEAGKGTGLGLSQVFGFVKQSGGHVKIYSEQGRGTAVKVYLPKSLGANEPDDRKLSPHALPKGTVDTVILVVEDETMVRKTTVSGLRELGYTVVHAGLPREALAILDARPEIALLFTDVVLPDMSGRELADLARAKAPRLRVLFTTGYTRNAIVHNGLVDPGVAFLPKPFTLAQLAAKVSQALG
jgi:signal transduction histidine kinase